MEKVFVFIVLNLCKSIGESIEMQSSVLRMGGCGHVYEWMQLLISCFLGNILY